MKVVYLTQPRFLHPYYDDLADALVGLADLALYNVDTSAEKQFEGVDVVIEHGGPFSTPEMWAAASSAGVRLWQLTAAGIDRMDLTAFFQHGISLANMPGHTSTAIPMAEHAMTLMLAVAKRLRESQTSLDSRLLFEPLTSELYGKTLGLIGAGASGRELAQRAKAFGMRILAIDVVAMPPATSLALGIDFLGGPERLEQLLPEVDYVSLHVPLTTATRHILDKRLLALLRPTAVVVNTARGGLVDTTALVEALRAGRLRGAALDVIEDEPIDPSHPLRSLANVVLTPHIAAVTRELSLRRALVSRENVGRIRQGLPPLHEILS